MDAPGPKPSQDYPPVTHQEATDRGTERQSPLAVAPEDLRRVGLTDAHPLAAIVRRVHARTDDPELRRKLIDGAWRAHQRRGIARLRDRHAAIQTVGRFGRAEPIEAWELEALDEVLATEEVRAADPLQFSLQLADLVPDLNRFLRVGARRDDPRDLWLPTPAAAPRWAFVDLDTPTSANVIALEVPDGSRVAAAVEAGDIPPPRWLIEGLAWGAAAAAWTLARPVHLRPGCRARPRWLWWLVVEWLAEVTGGDPGYGGRRPRSPLTRNPVFAERRGLSVAYDRRGCISLSEVRSQYVPRARSPRGARRGLLPGPRAMIVVPDGWPTWRRAQRRGGRRRASMDSFEATRKAAVEAATAARIAKAATTREKVVGGVLAGFTDAEISGALQCSTRTVQRHRLAAGLTRPKGGWR